MRMCLNYALLIFYTSRRRHTRLQVDWSSYVCSSDLAAFVRVPHEHQLPFAQLEVRPATELIYVCRAGKDATKPGKLRCEDFRAYNAALLEPFKSTEDRKSTRLNSSHLVISYAVFCLK